MAASNICHSWSPFADNSASFLVTSSFVKAGTVLNCVHLKVTNTLPGQDKVNDQMEGQFNVITGTFSRSGSL